MMEDPRTVIVTTPKGSPQWEYLFSRFGPKYVVMFEGHNEKWPGVIIHHQDCENDRQLMETFIVEVQESRVLPPASKEMKKLMRSS